MGDLEEILAALNKTDTTPTLQLTSVQQTRFSDLAAGLETARINGYVEANFLTQLLDLVKELAPLFLKV